MSWTEIAQAMQNHFPELSEVQVREKVRTAIPRKGRNMDKPVGVFSDPHIPFQHPNYLQFCKDTFKQYGVGRIVCCGGLVDFHAISRHGAESCAKSSCDELDLTIKGAKEHNLKNIDLEIPRDKLVVITGLSGSGKSSLAFDTIYAEGQRRYVESLSSYARQFLGS